MEKSKNKSLIFRKGIGKTDNLEFRLGDQTVIEIQNPKQRIIPHDMVHYAVEQSFPFEGFLQLVFRGHNPEKAMEVLRGFAPQLADEYSQTSWITESLVESLQAALWSKIYSFEDFEYAYQKACEARRINPEPITEKDFSSCLELVKKLAKSGKRLKMANLLNWLFNLELKFKEN